MKKIVFALFILQCLLACKKTTVEPELKPDTSSLRTKDSLALIALYKACDGPNWMLDSKLDLWSDFTRPIDDEEYWRGIETGIVDGELRVTKIFLVSCKLEGKLPEEIGHLSELTWLDLSINNLTGIVPTGISKLTKLEHLNLGNNKFDLQPVNFIQDMVHLKDLLLKKNSFNAITSKLDDLQCLERLDIESNSFQELPASIGKLRSLECIYASQNEMTGLPVEVGQLSATLTHLILNGNKLSAFPEAIFQLSELWYLDISDNQISDTNEKEIRKKLPKLNIFNY